MIFFLKRKLIVCKGTTGKQLSMRILYMNETQMDSSKEENDQYYLVAIGRISWL